MGQRAVCVRVMKKDLSKRNKDLPEMREEACGYLTGGLSRRRKEQVQRARGKNLEGCVAELH